MAEIPNNHLGCRSGLGGAGFGTKGLENELQDLEIAHHRCTPPETGARGWDVADLKNDAGKIWKRQQAGGI